MKATTADAAKLFLNGTKVFARMEMNGFRIDTDYLDSAITEVKERIDQLNKEIKADDVYKIWRKRFGEATNLGSRPQLAKVIYEDLGHESIGVTKTGRKRTDKTALAEVDLPFLRKYEQVEKLKKLLSTNLEGVKKRLADGYLHPSYSLSGGSTDEEVGGARSLRASSSDPNCNNWPIRDPEMGKYARRLLVARPGYVIGENDFKSIEVCGAACVTKDPALIKYVSDPTTDMHRDMAAQIYKLELEQISKETRYCAKNQFVFPEFYGSYYFQCCKYLWEAIAKMKLKTVGGVSLYKILAKHGIKELGDMVKGQEPRGGTFERHIKEVEHDFWNRRFKVYNDWKRECWEEYQRTGGFDLLTGFHIEGVFRKNQVLNIPIQGIAFHCNLWTIIELQKWLDKHNMKTLIIGEIHDSVLLEIYLPELQDVLNKAHELTTIRLPKAWPWIIVPLTTEVEIAPEDKSWFDKKPWVNKGGTWKPKAA